MRCENGGVSERCRCDYLLFKINSVHSLLHSMLAIPAHFIISYSVSEEPNTLLELPLLPQRHRVECDLLNAQDPLKVLIR